MKKIYILFLIAVGILLTVSTSGFAYSYINNFYGDTILSADSRSMGMGNAGVAASYGASSIFYNPANMVKSGGGSLSITGGIRPFKEKIETPSGNIYYNSQLNYELSNISFLLPLGSSFRFGIGRFPLRDLNYTYERDIYSGNSLSEQYSYESEGNVSSIKPAVAFKIFNSMSLGLGVNILSGSPSVKDLTVAVDSTKSLLNTDVSVSGTSYDIGLNWKPSEVVSFGFNLTPGYSVKYSAETEIENFTWSIPNSEWNSAGTSTTNSEKEMTFPQTMAFGINYEFWEREMSTFALDIIKTSWEDFRYKEVKNTSDPNYDESIDPELYNTIILKAGVEHSLNVSTLLRYGFTFMPGYAKSGYDATIFTAGVGFPLNDSVDIDIAGAYGKRNYLGTAKSFSQTNLEVDETISRLTVNTVWKF